MSREWNKIIFCEFCNKNVNAEIVRLPTNLYVDKCLICREAIGDPYE